MWEAGKAILYALSEAGLVAGAPVLVINDRDRSLSGKFADAHFWDVDIDANPPQEKYAAVVLFAPKQKDEARFLMARGLQLLKANGLFMAVAGNEAGGKTLGKLLVGFGVRCGELAKHKCRIVWTTEPERAAKIMLDEARARGGLQQRGDLLWTQPGLFSWDHLDKGSDALLHHLPLSLKGEGADFGCGIGVIGLRLMQRYEDVKKLICIDIDARALDCAALNLSAWPERIFLRRADLSQPVELGKFDFIVMNPPFHTGKKQSVTLGQSFIRNAAANLKSGGMLVFVANSHLPYEAIIGELFSFHRTLSEQHGFKIIEAVK